MTRRRWAIVVFVGVGLCKIPLEHGLYREMLREKLHEPFPHVGKWDQVGQSLIAASLGGLRSFAASVAEIKAWIGFDRSDWPMVDSWMKITTTLEPREPFYWDEWGWHMSYNAASYYFYHKQNAHSVFEEDEKNLMTYTYSRDYINRGIQVLKDGLEYLPDNPTLLERLGTTYRERAKNPAEAGKYLIAAAHHGALDYLERVGAYEYAKTNDPALWREAYKILKHNYDIGKAPYTLMRVLPELEEKLHIPADQRIKGEPSSPHRPATGISRLKAPLFPGAPKPAQ